MKLDKHILQLYRALLEIEELMHAWMSERVAVYGTLDYTFFSWYYERRIELFNSFFDALSSCEED